MASYPKDQFDDVPVDLARVGAHRGPEKKGRGWIAFAWAALATGLIIVGGLFAVSLLNGNLDSQEAAPEVTETPIETAEPLTDPRDIDDDRDISITVLNGTDTNKLDNVAYKALKKAKWPMSSHTNASSDTIATTVVYYAAPEDEDVARGVAAELGFDTVAETDVFLGAPITVVLGADYAEAQE